MANIGATTWDTSVAKVGLTPSIGGAALTAGERATGSVVIPGASALLKANPNYATQIGAALMASPAFTGGPGAGFTVDAYLDDATVTDQVTVAVTAVAAGTPTAGVYTVFVMPF